MNPLANLHLPQVPALQYVLQDFLPDFQTNINQLAAQGFAPVAEFYTGAWANVGFPHSAGVLGPGLMWGNRSIKAYTAPTKIFSQHIGNT
jgi:hypothetical protein